MMVILSGGRAGGQEIDVAEDAETVEVDAAVYKILPPDPKNPEAPRMATYAGDAL